MFFNFFRELDEKYHKDDEELNRVMAHFQFMLLGENYIHDYTNHNRTLWQAQEPLLFMPGPDLETFEE